MALSDDVRAAYSEAGESWQRGPARIYDRMAELLVSRSPVPFAGSVVADVGAGTGAAGRAAHRAGARAVVAVDLAAGMLRADPGRPPAAVADARALPLRSGSVDVALAAFSLNHLPDPAAGLREAARVVRPGGAVVAGAYAGDDTHPVKDAVEEALRRHGWRVPAWVERVRTEAMSHLATVEGARAVGVAAGLPGIVVEHHRRAFPGLEPRAMVAWRAGMAQHAPFLARLDPGQRACVVEEAVALLGDDPPPLVRSVIVFTAVC